MEELHLLIKGKLFSKANLVCIKFDIRNAFGSMSKAVILKAVAALRVPLLSAYFIATYAKGADVLFRHLNGSQVRIHNEVGVQQGNALSGLFFALGLHPVLTKLNERGYDLVKGYLDDCFVVCSEAQARELVDGGFQGLLEECETGLKINVEKTIIYSPFVQLEASEWDCSVTSEGSVFLGVPVGSENFVRLFIEEALEKTRVLCDKIKTLPTQHAYLLLRFCVTTRLNHLWRSCPSSWCVQLAQRASDTVWGAMREVLQIPSDTEANRLGFNLERARKAMELSTAVGGAGILSPKFTVTSAFLAGLKEGLVRIKESDPDLFTWWCAQLSRVGDLGDTRSEIVSMIQSARCCLSKLQGAVKHLSVRGRLCLLPAEELTLKYPKNIMELMGSLPKTQKTLTSLFHDVARHAFMSNLTQPMAALILSRASPKALSFLSVIPSCSAFTLSCDQMRFALRSIMFLPPINSDFIGPAPSSLSQSSLTNMVDAYSRFRALFRSVPAYSRHDGLMEEFTALFKSVGLSCRREVQVPGGGHRNRVDLVVNGLNMDGSASAFDVTVVASDGVLKVGNSSVVCGAAAAERALLKVDKYTDACRQVGMSFHPLVFEESGFVHVDIQSILKLCASRASDFCDSIPEFQTWGTPNYFDYWSRRLSVKLVRGNAKMIRSALAKWSFWTRSA